MPLNDNDDGLSEELEGLHCHTLTVEQWEVIRLNASGQSAKQIGSRMSITPNAVRALKRRAGSRIFAHSSIEPSDGSLGAWCGRHWPCCRQQA
ncbi:MAG: LuxR C-terminal-related transcriptional regulator [Tepidiformaceae bacterium]